MICRGRSENTNSIYSRSFLVGDKETDVECGHNAGVACNPRQNGTQT